MVIPSSTTVTVNTRDATSAKVNAEIARLSDAVKELAVKLTLVEGKGGWD